METLNNFSSIYCFITFVIGAVFMLAMLSIAAMGKDKEPRNKVHFIVTKQERLCLIVLNKSKEWFHLCDEEDFIYWNLNPEDFADMKEGEIREVFINLED